MIKNKKRLGNMLSAGMMTLLLWAVFSMFGQGLAPLPADGEFSLVAWARERVRLVGVAVSEEDDAYEEYEGDDYGEYEEAHEKHEGAEHEYADHEYEEDDDDDEEYGEHEEYEVGLGQ